MALNGKEILYVLGVQANGQPSSVTEQTTTQAIANLASGGGADQQITNTAITTVGNGTLTAAAIAGGLITRTGSVAAYTDTTDTAAAIVAAIPNAFVGQSFILRIKNGVNFAETLAAGTGVTLTAGTAITPPSSISYYLVTLTSLTAVTILHLLTAALTNNTPEAVTTLTTVGAGTITGAGIGGGLTTRGGAQSGSAFSDTTDTATAIIAGQFNAHVGVSWEYTYLNNTDAKATLLAGSGVTLSGITVVPPNGWVKYLVTYTVASTITMASIGSGSFTADATDTTKQIALKASGATTGTIHTIASVDTASRTSTLPDVTGVFASTSGTNLYTVDLKKCSGSVTANATTTYANVTGLSFTVVPGTYEFVCRLPSTVASGTGGIKYAFNYTTTVLTSIESTGRGYTASAVAVVHTTTTTTQTDLFTQAAIVIFTEITGTMVVSTGGTVDVQMAQNTSNASNTIALVGASAQFTRIA